MINMVLCIAKINFLFAAALMLGILKTLCDDIDYDEYLGASPLS